MRNGENKKIRTSIVISIVSLLASILLTFVFNKFLLDQPQIGDVNFGLKSTVDSLTSFVSIFVLGMSSTFIRFHRKYENEENSLFASFNIIVLILSGAALVFGIVLVVLSANNLILNPADGKYTPKQVHDFIVILSVSLFFLLASIVLSCNKWFLESVKAIVFVRLVNLICVILYPTISIFFVLQGADMIGVTIIYTLVYLGGFISYLVYRLIKTHHKNPFIIHGFKGEIIKEIVCFSFFVVIVSFIETFNHSVDKIILTIGFGAAYTTLYQLSMSINQVLLTLCDTLYAPYIPYISDDAKNQDLVATQKTYNKVSFILLFLSFTLIIGFFAAGKDFVTLWLGATRINVYYFALIIFLPWPLYAVAKFSLQIHRAYNKHYKSALLLIASFAIHLITTFSLIWTVGIWACIAGTATSMLFLGISFLIYNKKALSLAQIGVVKRFLKLLLAATITCVVMFFVNQAFDRSGIESHLLLLVIKGLVALCIWIVLAAFVLFKESRNFVKHVFFDEFDSAGRIARRCFFGRLKDALGEKRKKINSAISLVLIAYFLFNFASYYLGGIVAIQGIVNSPFFEYGTKFVSYGILLAYFFIFFLANDLTINRTEIVLLFFALLGCVVSTIVVPKNTAIQTVNRYNVLVELHFEAGFLDLLIGNLNYVVDLFVMFFFVFHLRDVFTPKSIRPFLSFIIAFGLLECLFSFVLDFKDYIYFFRSGGEESTEFSGYATNISGTFQSKNGFGFLLFGSFVAAVFEFYRRRKWYFVGAGLLISVVAVFSLCKTALLSIVFLTLFVVTALLFEQYRKRKKTFWILLGVFGFVVVCFGFLFTPLARNIPLIDRLCKKIISFFVVSGGATTRSRSIIWLQALDLLKGPFVIVGYGKPVSLNMLSLVTNMSTLSFHNSLLGILCAYGVIGLAIYIFAIAYVLLFFQHQNENALHNLAWNTCFIIFIWHDGSCPVIHE